ncbi:hypothetical protein BaRGS_00021851 [Batillaria attramentaria]|uniref:Uncharacterized protein n=1 Tax=Batillaria attramentaria TaxID=370345 RepID=A0ABD0KJ13_9CAEN
MDVTFGVRSGSERETDGRNVRRGMVKSIPYCPPIFSSSHTRPLQPLYSVAPVAIITTQVRGTQCTSSSSSIAFPHPIPSALPPPHPLSITPTPCPHLPHPPPYYSFQLLLVSNYRYDISKYFHPSG